LSRAAEKTREAYNGPARDARKNSCPSPRGPVHLA